MKLTEISKEITDVIEGAGPLGVPSKLCALPGGDCTIECIFDLCQLHPQLADLLLRGRFPSRDRRELLNLFFDLANRFFKLEVIAHTVSTHIDEIIGRERKHP